MGVDQQADTKKDKRLLVLLAFGVLLLGARLQIPELIRESGDLGWGWLEIRSGNAPPALYRTDVDGTVKGLSLPGVNPDALRNILRDHQAAVVQSRAGHGDGISAAISPRLALLLGLPFPINRATTEELTLLQGIGPHLAASIVSYRERHGRISDEQVLTLVPGIGQRLAARLAPLLSFD